MRYRKLKLALVALFLSAAVTLAAAEIMLRAAGFKPWERLVSDKDWGGSMNEPDSVLGWKRKPGQYTVKAFVPGVEDLKVTIQPGGWRATGREAQGGRPRLVVVGCSFTEGQWLSDEETVAWKLQAKFPEIAVQNYGVAGYGTYQSLLLMERIFAEPNPPKMVLYGFIENHGRRNVASVELLEAWTKASRTAPRFPYVSLNGEGELVRHLPDGYPQWPLREHSALVNFSQKMYAYAWLIAEKRRWTQAAVTEKLILEMDNLAKRNGAQFAVVTLVMDRGTGKPTYIELFEKKNIPYIDCDYPLTDEFTVPEDGHPNDIMADLYAECMADGIKEKSSVLIGRKSAQSAALFS